MIYLFKFEETKSYEIFNALMELRDELKKFNEKISNGAIARDDFYFKKEFSDDNFDTEPAYLEANVHYNENAEFKLVGSIDFTDFYEHMCESKFMSREISNFSIDQTIFDFLLHIFPNNTN